MFNDKKNNKSTMEAGNTQNRIGQGTVIEGDIKSEGGFRIDGTIHGNLVTPGKVVIGKDGKVDGTLTCANADIEGSFSGTLEVGGILSLKSTAVIDGEVTTQKLSVEPGAAFNASCVMGSKPAKTEKKKEQEPKA
ncbi:bactofilin family protein [Nonlabens xiamenensis]|uniref:bactofilin family protein n=1 Tax=Nonlabens xiamenensis TaxID=2341043 RepID=UPI000F611172|nr:polymer-forming cytoskeletal protein [Nonlabens xiamenensis]